MSGANAPRAERHWRHYAIRHQLPGALWGGERPSRRKALETSSRKYPIVDIDAGANAPRAERHWRLQVSLHLQACPVVPGRTPLAPKGIGDWFNGLIRGETIRKGRTPLAPKGIGDSATRAEATKITPGANAPRAERHWRRHACIHAANVMGWGRTPLAPKGIGDFTRSKTSP